MVLVFGEEISWKVCDYDFNSYSDRCTAIEVWGQKSLCGEERRVPLYWNNHYTKYQYKYIVNFYLIKILNC